MNFLERVPIRPFVSAGLLVPSADGGCVARIAQVAKRHRGKPAVLAAEPVRRSRRFARIECPSVGLAEKLDTRTENVREGFIKRARLLRVNQAGGIFGHGVGVLVAANIHGGQ